MYVKFCNHITKTLEIIQDLVITVLLGHPVANVTAIVKFKTCKRVV